MDDMNLFVIIILVVIAGVVIDALFTKTVVNSDLPLWLKFFILRR